MKHPTYQSDIDHSVAENYFCDAPATAVSTRDWHDDGVARVGSAVEKTQCPSSAARQAKPMAIADAMKLLPTGIRSD